MLQEAALTDQDRATLSLDFSILRFLLKYCLQVNNVCFQAEFPGSIYYDWPINPMIRQTCSTQGLLTFTRAKNSLKDPVNGKRQQTLIHRFNIMSKATPTEINLNQRTRTLSVSFNDGNVFEMSCEYLRVHSPSAEVQGHGPGQEVLQVGKENVNITAIEPVGNYAIKPTFDDGHDSGIFSWDTLYVLGKNQQENWQIYLDRLTQAGHERKLDA